MCNVSTCLAQDLFKQDLSPPRHQGTKRRTRFPVLRLFQAARHSGAANMGKPNWRVAKGRFAVEKPQGWRASLALSS
jgi:hypothetical protein